MSKIQALQGLKVLDLAWVVAGPAVGRALADYGAMVVRVESSQRIETARLIGPYLNGITDPQRCALYDTYNAGKLGLTLNLGSDAGKDVLRDLALWADVLIESFAPGQMARWNLSPDALRESNPRLIVLSTSLMGQTGPMASFAGYGNVGAALAGFQGLAGWEGALPVGPYGPYTDYVGPRFALLALLAALDRCRVTGQGCWLDVSQVEAGIQFLGSAVANAAATGQTPRLVGNKDPQYAPHGVYRCVGQDEWVAVVARTDEEWRRLALLIGGEAAETQWSTLELRKASEQKLDVLVEAWTSIRPALEVERAVQGIGVPAHKVASSKDVVEDSQLQARGHFVRLPHPLGGESVFDASRYRLSETPATYSRPAPHFGRDVYTVLTDALGYDAARIEQLHEAGVLR